MLRVVLDANVFVSAAIRPEGVPGRLLQSFLREQAFELVVSPEIAAEVARALAYPDVRKQLRRADATSWLDDILLLADLVEDAPLAAPVCADPDDDKYLAAASNGRATVVVSGDNDLLALHEYEGIRVLTPRSFLDLLEARRRPRRS